MTHLVAGAGILLSAQLIVVTCFFVKKNVIANRIFSLVVFVIMLLLLSAFRSCFSWPYELLHIFGSLVLLLSPLIFFYVRATVGKLSWSWYSFVHFLPFFLHLGLLLPLYVGDASLRAATIDRYLSMEIYRSLWPGVRIGGLQALAYWGGCFLWVRKLEKHINDNASFSDQFHLQWLRLFTSMLLVILVLMGLVRVFYGEAAPIIWVICFTALLSAIHVVALAKPDLFHPLPDVLMLPKEESKYEYSKLENTQKEDIAQRLLIWFDATSPYLNDDLTLAQVCKALSLPRASVSQVINEHFGKCFQEFVNDYRIKAAKAMLTDPQKDFMSVDGIGLEVGFRSRSAFYRVFKAHTDMTPGAWRKNKGA